MSRQKPTIPRNREPCDLPSEKSTDSFWHSQPSALLTAHRSTRDLPAEADVVVVGSGMTGTSVAHHILNDDNGKGSRSGYGTEGPSVVMLEAREACWGATGRNGGHCQPILFEHPHEPEIGHFELANFHTLQSLIEEKKIDCEFVAQPGVRAIYDSQHMIDTELALLTIQETAPELGRMMRIVTDKSELESLRIPTAVGAVVTSVAARMWPYKFVSRILEDLLTSTELNGTFNLQTLTPVEGLEECGRRWMVKTSRGSILASKVVLATNAYTSHLLPNFADLIVPCRGQMSALIPLPSVAGENRLKTSVGFLGDGLDDYLIQRPNERGGHLMFGGGRQHGPSIGTTDDSGIDEKTAKYLRSRLVDALGLPEGKDKQHELIGCDRCKAQNTRCVRTTALKPCMQCRRFCQPCTNSNAIHPGSERLKNSFAATHEWTGIMGFSRDDHPWIGPVPGKPFMYIAAGYTGHGMPNTWLCGKAVALMIMNTLSSKPTSKQDDDLADLACQKYFLNPAGRASSEEVGFALDFSKLPEGADNCLAGESFVFTGNLPSLNREQSQSLVERCGGKVTRWPSKDTTHVILGEEAGKKKLEIIEQLGLHIITEPGLLFLIKARSAVKRVLAEDEDTKASRYYKGFSAKGPIVSAADKVGLPRSYLVTKERVLKAMEIEDVEAKDRAEMERGRRREQADRPHSGYA